MRISSIGLIAAVALGLGGCATNGLGVGIGSGYGGGYGGYGGGYGYDAYGYDRYGYGYGYPYGYSPYGYNPYGGWTNGYYYPGTGGWVYDRDGRRREANFGGLGEAFRQAVKNRNATTTTTTTTTTVAPTTRVRAPARTRVIERSERRTTATTRSRDSGARILRRKSDD